MTRAYIEDGAAGLSPQPFILLKDRCHCEERSDEANPNDEANRN